jgi:tRNA 2-thiouridine synthesizing protein E
MMPDIMKFIMNDESLETDPNGYLLHLDDWSEEIAGEIALQENIEMTERHWEVVRFLRDHYKEYGASPNVRLLMKVVARELGQEKGTRKYLYDLFPQGPSRQGCRIAGLPLPNDCIDFS